MKPAVLTTCRLLGLLALAACWPVVTTGQVTITSVTTVTGSSGGNSTEGGTNPTTLTFENDYRYIETFVAGGVSYGTISTANTMAVRRNTGAGNANNSSVWMQNTGASNTVEGTDRDNVTTLMRDNNIYQGLDNAFANGTGVSQGNIERLDFLWSSGFTVGSDSDGIAVFERGVAGAHDAFQVAAITSLGSSIFSPTTWTFGSVLEIGSSDYGSNLDLDNSGGGADNINYRLLRYDNGNVLTSHTDGSETGTQGLAGTFITFADLGISVGTTVYGYAVMGSDVTNSSANLADWTAATYYPTNTNDSYGGLDMASFGGRVSRPVPEPSTYGAMLVAGLGGWLGWRRRRAATAAAQA